MKPYYDEGGIVIYHGNCLELREEIVEFDQVITDPPYSIWVHAHHRSGVARNGGYGRPKELGFAPMDGVSIFHCGSWFARAKRWALVFSDMESTHVWREALTTAGLEYIRTGVWVKLAAMPQFTGDRPGAGFETITIAHPVGKKRWNGGGSQAVWSHQVVKGGTCETEPRVHPAQKPYSLVSQLIGLFSEPTELILDPYMGSGTTLAVAKDLGRRAIGIEIEERYCEIAAKRLAQGVLGL